MPKETFFRLPKEKQQRLIDAARIEFSKSSLQEASIANIVKLADIPRGSFYQYFENKEDLYFYYFENLRSIRTQDIEACIKEHDGDFFIGFETYFRQLIEDVFTGPNVDFYRNLFLHIDFKATNRFSPESMADDKMSEYHHQKMKKHLTELKHLIAAIDTSSLNVKTERELIMLFKLMMSIVFASINSGYYKQKRGKELVVKELIEEFSTKINWLKNGVYLGEKGE